MSLAVSWLLTYLLHSTLLLGLAAVVRRWLPGRALALEETVWKTALVGGLLTASLQVGLGVEPRITSWQIAATERVEPGVVAARSAVDPSIPPIARQSLATGVATGSARRPTVPAPGARSVEPTTAVASPSPVPAQRSVPWKTWTVAFWSLVALVLAGRLALSCLALARRLADRRPLASGRLRALLADLERAARMTGVGLSASSRISSPLALGWRRREICLPDRVVTDLAEERQELVLAHELAHHARRDPLWLLAGRFLEAVFFFQPLNRVARRRLQEIAEYRCDDWAVERTGRPVTLARCLADVAEWSLAADRALPVPTLAVERRRLGRRVSRLLDRSYPYPAMARPRWLVAGVGVVLVATVLLAPGVSSGHPPPRAPEAPEALESPMPAPPPPPAIATEDLDIAPPPAPAIAPPAVAVAPTPPAPLAPGARIVPMPAPAPAPPVVAVPDVPIVSVTPALAPSAPPLAVAPTPAPPGPAPRAPLPPAPTAAENGDWVIREDRQDRHAALAPVAFSQLAMAEDLSAVVGDELAMAGDAYAAALAAEDWAVMAHEMAAVADVAPELMAELAAYTHELEELSEISPELAERWAELARRMAAAAQPDPEAMARVERLSAELAERWQVDAEATARLEALSRELAESALPDREMLERYEELARRVGDRPMTDEERAELEAMRAEMHRELAERNAARREEITRLREEIRREMEANRPDREEIARVREEIRRELKAARPDREEMARLREELRAELEAALPERIVIREEHQRVHREELRRLRAEQDERRREMEERRREVEETRRERDREVEELRAEVERLRAEVRRLEEEDDG